MPPAAARVLVAQLIQFKAHAKPRVAVLGITALELQATVILIVMELIALTMVAIGMLQRANARGIPVRVLHTTATKAFALLAAAAGAGHAAEPALSALASAHRAFARPRQAAAGLHKHAATALLKAQRFVTAQI